MSDVEYPGPNGYEKCTDPECEFRWGDAEHGHQPAGTERQDPFGLRGADATPPLRNVKPDVPDVWA